MKFKFVNEGSRGEVDITFDAMKMNNYSDSLCSAEKYSSDLHVKNMGLMFTLVESYKLPDCFSIWFGVG